MQLGLQWDAGQRVQKVGCPDKNGTGGNPDCVTRESRDCLGALVSRGLSRLSAQGGMVAMLGGSRPNPFCKCAIVGLYVPHSTLLTVLGSGRVESFRGWVLPPPMGWLDKPLLVSKPLLKKLREIIRWKVINAYEKSCLFDRLERTAAILEEVVFLSKILSVCTLLENTKCARLLWCSKTNVLHVTYFSFE